MYKRYFLIVYDNYYPYGGVEDIKFRFDTYEELEDHLKCSSYIRYDHIKVFDNLEWKEVESIRIGYHNKQEFIENVKEKIK